MSVVLCKRCGRRVDTDFYDFYWELDVCENCVTANELEWVEDERNEVAEDIRRKELERYAIEGEQFQAYLESEIRKSSD